MGARHLSKNDHFVIYDMQIDISLNVITYNNLKIYFAKVQILEFTRRW